MERPTPQATPEMTMERLGAVPDDFVEYAYDKVTAVFRYSPEPVLFARVKLSMAANPAVGRPALAQTNLDVNGRLVRVQVAAETMFEAVDQLHDRLQRRLGRVSKEWEPPHGSPSPPEWRQSLEPAGPPGYSPLPAEEREVVRHKSFTLSSETPDEAAFDMEMLDYEFLLFTDAETDQDSVIYHSEGGYRLAQVDPQLDRRDPIAVPLTISPHPAPRLSVSEATEYLDTTGLPWVFFVNEATGRGNVLYRRYDGNYGLITPA
ncbi:MAG: HPF/RaiA family ribosome-associated protein [Actinomadura sp.]